MKLIRLFIILRTLVAYRVTNLLPINSTLGWHKLIHLLAPFAPLRHLHLSDGQRLRTALEKLGPIFIKLGQTLSTRPDLIPVEIAKALEKLQDDVEPISWSEAKAVIDAGLNGQAETAFQHIEEQALASASIAQVHAATLANGDDVVIKILRPGIGKKITRDVALMKHLAAFADRFLSPGVQVDHVEIVEEFEKTIHDELDLQREAANASVLRKHFNDSKDLYIPKIYWDHCKTQIMVQERIHGISIKDFDALRAANINFEALAEKGLNIFYTQVFRDNFFHADMHPGNIFINPDNPEDPQIILLDFGICGSLPKGHRVDLANNFMAFFKQDYRRIAELHIESGWVPEDTNLEDLEAATRTICEPYFSRPIEEISFGEVMLKTFQMAKRFQLIIQPEFILLQKTLLNIEGLGRQLYPQLDIWQSSEPVLRDIMKNHYGSQNAMKKIKQNLPKWLDQLAEAPQMFNQLLAQQVKPLPRHMKLAAQKAEQKANRDKRQNRCTLLAAGALISGTVLLNQGGSASLIESLPNSSLVFYAISAVLALWSMKK